MMIVEHITKNDRKNRRRTAEHTEGAEVFADRRFGRVLRDLYDDTADDAMPSELREAMERLRQISA